MSSHGSEESAEDTVARLKAVDKEGISSHEIRDGVSSQVVSAPYKSKKKVRELKAMLGKQL